MTEEEAHEALAAAVRQRDATKTSWDSARNHLHRTVREASAVMRQVDLVRATGYTRERIRQICAGD